MENMDSEGKKFNFPILMENLKRSMIYLFVLINKN